MKLLTLNFLTCARKSCKSSPAAFPLHPREVELEQIEVDLNPLFIRNMLPRLDWEAMRAVTQELGLPPLPSTVPEPDSLEIPSAPAATDAAAETGEVATTTAPSQTLQDLHTLLLETSIASGKLACGNCGHEYAVKEGIANFLLPSHLV
ncbi:Trm112p-domain-containing protein [Dissoconium aciculare CBS 342.82]|uniref:Trm112p-domain-containing protein n=1 Tax=Dissoconium aciculare CBS 342.82 TaxID=1314786 RepID=A0A6J3MBY0_9PEZI|nr:Trm112p-domain-containing protein [Dissoconium aciculare CBS 342.82]KAF1824347.1 Trm112p-domain-containing protein [Dissoconium aciculare CBS 342.82]